MRKLLASVLTVFSVMVIPAVVSAHVAVKPSEVGVGEFQTYTMSVPNEKEIAVTSLRVVVPTGVKEVSPTVKPGWEVTTKKSGDVITEIDWNGGTVPAGMRDDFTFSAQAPAKSTTLAWKAYQTYEDGTTVAWDQKPSSTKGDDESGSSGPYSTTSVVNDLDKTESTTQMSEHGSSDAGAYLISGAALVLAVIALFAKRK